MGRVGGREDGGSPRIRLGFILDFTDGTSFAAEQSMIMYCTLLKLKLKERGRVIVRMLKFRSRRCMTHFPLVQFFYPGLRNIKSDTTKKRGKTYLERV